MRLDERYRDAGDFLRREQRFGQRAGRGRLVRRQRVLEHEARHDVPRDQGLGEADIAVESQPQQVQRGPDFLVGGQLACRQLVDQPFRGVFLGLGEQHVETKHADAVVIEQPVDDRRQRIPRPRPLAQLELARLVDLDDYDARVDGIRHRQPQPSVVQIMLDAVDDLEPRRAGNMQHEQQQRRSADGNSNEMPGPAASGSSLHGYSYSDRGRTNAST
ncbi:MAG: hypothetical protein U5K76_10810 [Woeseiaceae bacterium]|nr:hypothetical protein [Woeseiaceae bacterium]